jgi:hypothetical protein
MSSWNGIEDEDANSQHPLSPSPPSSPFSAAFRTPRPPGIQTGIRDVPPSLSEHPEDLYDTLQVEFDRAIINNSNRRNKTRLIFKERGYIIRHLTMTESTWRDLPTLEKSNQKRNRRAKTLKYFEIKGTLLIYKPETIAKGINHEIYLLFRQAALDDDVYYIIKQAHKRLEYINYKKTYKTVRLDIYSINREEVK